MGITGLWDIIGDGDIESVAELAAIHFGKTGRSFRVAIDEAGWRFNNLNDAQVAKIRESEPAANPIEKLILYRILKLLRLNIVPIFIFDGPSRPWKRGGTAGRIDWKKIDLLRKVLDHLKLPHHRAPAEAEAECARLQTLGIVDAVWSDDGDTLMFGATYLIRDYRDGKKAGPNKSDTHVRVYKADKIKDQFGLDRPGLILFALLNGGDYNARGLPNCGPKPAHAAARWQDGHLGRRLCAVPLKEMHVFTLELQDYFYNHASRKIYVSPDFPRALHVKNYRDPKVSTVEQCHDLQALRNGWDIPIDEFALRPFLRARFQFRAKEYIRHIVPILLLQRLLNTPPDDLERNSVLDIKLIHKRGKTADDYKMERLLSFDPLPCSKLYLTRQPEDEDWSIWTDKKTGTPWDPAEHIEIEMLDCFVTRGLGVEEMTRLQEDASKPKSNKRKSAALETEELGEPAKAKRKSIVDKHDLPTDSSDPIVKRRKSKKAPVAKKEKSPPPEAPKFRLPTSLQTISIPPTETSIPRSERDQAVTDIQLDEVSSAAASSRAPPFTNRVDSGIGINVCADKKSVEPFLQVPDRVRYWIERIREMMDAAEAEFRRLDADELDKEEARVNNDLENWRKLVELQVLRKGRSAHADVLEFFGPDTTHLLSENLRKECHERAVTFLKSARKCLLLHIEAIANCCAMENVLRRNTGKSRCNHDETHGVRNPTPHDDLEMIGAAILWEYHIEELFHREFGAASVYGSVSVELDPRSDGSQLEKKSTNYEPFATTKFGSTTQTSRSNQQAFLLAPPSSSVQVPEYYIIDDEYDDKEAMDMRMAIERSLQSTSPCSPPPVRGSGLPTAYRKVPPALLAPHHTAGSTGEQREMELSQMLPTSSPGASRHNSGKIDHEVSIMPSLTTQPQSTLTRATISPPTGTRAQPSNSPVSASRESFTYGSANKRDLQPSSTREQIAAARLKHFQTSRLPSSTPTSATTAAFSVTISGSTPTSAKAVRSERQSTWTVARLPQSATKGKRHGSTDTEEVRGAKEAAKSQRAQTHIEVIDLTLD